MDSMEMYLAMLFNNDEFICVCRTLEDIDSTKKSNLILGNDIQWVSCNPIKPYCKRGIGNVLEFRNLVFESDVLSVDDQLKAANELRLPYSTCTFSGNKSLHFVVSLEGTEIRNVKEYRHQHLWVQNIFKKQMDRALSNPQALTRIPEGTNKKYETEQKLIALNSRISYNKWIGWLESYKNLEPKEKMLSEDIQIKDKSALNYGTVMLIETGDNDYVTARHTKLRTAMIDLFHCGYSEEEILGLTRKFRARHPDKSDSEIFRLLDWIFDNLKRGQVGNSI